MGNYDHRPPVEERQTNDRTEPARIKVRTRWFYSETSTSGVQRHAFSRSGDVVESDVPAPSKGWDSIGDHVDRAIELFGDDADLIIEVRRA